MLNIDIKDLSNIKEELDSLGTNEDVVYVSDEDETKYVILPIETFDDLQQYKEAVDNQFSDNPGVKIISRKPVEMTYEEYEKIKKQLVDAFDKSFKPKPSKLN